MRHTNYVFSVSFLSFFLLISISILLNTFINLLSDQPQQIPEQTIYGAQVDKSVFATVTIQANPRPRTGWFVDGSEISEGTYQDRYEARTPVELVSFFLFMFKPHLILIFFS